MTGIRIVIHVLILYVLLLIGNWIQDLFNLFIPGSVIGMILLFLLLKTGILKIEWIIEGTSIILKHLTLFFMPVTIGFINYLDTFSGKGIWLFLIALFSTMLVMGISGSVSQILARRKERDI